MRRPVLVLALALAVVAGLAGPLPVRAAGITFGASNAAATYDQKIEFTTTVTSPSPLARVELRLGLPDALGPYIVDVPVAAGGGTQDLRYSLDLTGSGHLVPNTPITYTWAAFETPGAEPVLSQTGRLRYQDTTEDWKTLKGDLITVHWYDGSESFAKRALDIGEQAVRDTSALLGVTERDPIDFFIYADQAAFRTALGPGTRENVGGQAHADIRTLFALITPDAIDDAWVGIVVPHELTHLVFDTAVKNPYRFPPRWLNEGLAVYLSEGYGSGDRNRVADAVDTKELIPLVALGGQFPTDPDKTSLAYAEAVSAIDYLVGAKGKGALISLVLAYRDGLTDDEAFQRALGQDLATFEAGWLASLGAAVPERFGPQPAPPGPLPSGWSGEAPTGSTAPRDPAVPAASAAPDSPAPAPSSDGTTVPLVVGGLLLVALVVAGGLVVARRRGVAQ